MELKLKGFYLVANVPMGRRGFIDLLGKGVLLLDHLLTNIRHYIATKEMIRTFLNSETL